MKKFRYLFITSAVFITLMFASCATSPQEFIADTIINVITDEDKMENIKESFNKIGEEITPSMAYYVGRQVASSVLGTYKVYDNKEATAYVNSVCSSLAITSADPYAYKGYWVAILDTDDINAMATPGGHIFVSKGLIKCTDSEDALAAVIAHELSHIQLKHSVKALKSDSTAQGVLTAMKQIGDAALETAEDNIGGRKIIPQEQIDSFAKYGSEITETLVNSGFSKTQEFAADKNALTVMLDAGYDPNAMIDMLEMIKANTSSGGEKKGWQKTHPEPQSRIDRVTKILEKTAPQGYSDRSIRQERFDNFKKKIK